MVGAGGAMRKTAQFPATDGRDKNKLFLLTEMSSAQGEEWALRVLLALMGAGIDLPDNFHQLGMAGLAQMGFKAMGKLSWDTLKPLLVEMFSTIQIIPDPKKPQIHRELIDDDIEEITTRLKLRGEFWKLHMGFLEVASQSLIEKREAAEQESGTRTSRK
jgi:hypothetical protein